MINLIRRHYKLILIILCAVLVLALIIFSSLIPQPGPRPDLVPLIATPSATPSIDPGTVPASDSFEYNQALVEIIQKYPWYPSLPLETKDYRVIYDFEKNQFRIRIFNAKLTSAQIRDVTAAALRQMTQIGINTITYTYYVVLGTTSP
jgi:hypothetical protein